MNQFAKLVFPTPSTKLLYVFLKPPLVEQKIMGRRKKEFGLCPFLLLLWKTNACKASRIYNKLWALLQLNIPNITFCWFGGCHLHPSDSNHDKDDSTKTQLENNMILFILQCSTQRQPSCQNVLKTDLPPLSSLLRKTHRLY